MWNLLISIGVRVAKPVILGCTLATLFFVVGENKAAAQVEVAVLNTLPVADVVNSAQELVAQLNDDTFFDFNATAVDADQIDTLEELAEFDVVVFGSNGEIGSLDDVNLVGAIALRDWVRAGGGVVAAGWIDFEIGDAFPSTPRDIALDDVIPIDASAFPNFNCGLGTTLSVSPTHPVTDGITELPGGANFVEWSPIVDDPQATSLAVLSNPNCDVPDAAHSIVVGPNGNGRNVFLGFLYAGDTQRYDTEALRFGDADRLLEQAVYWAGTSGISDLDQDGVLDDDDNCPVDANPSQTDNDNDGLGDACDPPDNDGDGVIDRDDNCPEVPNPDQFDDDQDGEGNACEPEDNDFDGVPNEFDNCPDDENTDQNDEDQDGVGDACQLPEESNGGDTALSAPGGCSSAPSSQFLFPLFFLIGFVLRKRRGDSNGPL